MGWFKLQLNFRQCANGWNEEYYKYFTDQPTSNSPSKNLLDARTAFMGAGVKLQSYRWIDLERQRKAKIKTIRLESKATNASGQTASPATTAAVLRLSSSFGTDRRLWMRGMRQDWVKMDDDGGSVILSPFRDATDKFVGLLASNSYAIRLQSQAANVPFRHISQWAESTVYPGWTQFAVVGDTAMGVGTRVYFTGAQPCDMVPITTDQVIQNITDGNIHHIAHPWTPGIGPQNTTTSRVRERTYNFETITSGWSLIYFRSHDTGRPIGLPAGRRKRRKCVR